MSVVRQKRDSIHFYSFVFFFDRLKFLMGFEKEDLVGHVPFEYHHHEDVAANLQCSKGRESHATPTCHTHMSHASTYPT